MYKKIGCFLFAPILFLIFSKFIGNSNGLMCYACGYGNGRNFSCGQDEASMPIQNCTGGNDTWKSACSVHNYNDLRSRDAILYLRACDTVNINTTEDELPCDEEIHAAFGCYCLTDLCNGYALDKSNKTSRRINSTTPSRSPSSLTSPPIALLLVFYFSFQIAYSGVLGYDSKSSPTPTPISLKSFQQD